MLAETRAWNDGVLDWFYMATTATTVWMMRGLYIKGRMNLWIDSTITALGQGHSLIVD